jgi:magnesium transporter
MSTDFATVLESMNGRQAIDKVRTDAPSKKMVYYIYVVDDEMKMQGFLTLKDLIMASPDATIRDLVHRDYVFARVSEDRESVAFKIEKYDLVAIPVLNEWDQLAGIITHDEAIEIIRAEHTEDLEKFMGITPDHQDMYYLETSSFQHFRKRITWIVMLAILGITSGLILHHFGNVLEQLIVLAMYMPMMVATGGNVGSQAATVVIRALALGHVSLQDWGQIILKEAKIAVFLALCLGLLAIGQVLIISWGAPLPAHLKLIKIALVVGAALSLQVISSTMIGAALPLLVRRLGGDPAIAASPAITTLVDITGLIIYFNLAVLTLGLNA